MAIVVVVFVVATAATAAATAGECCCGQNEKADYDPDHWFEINLANALLFANLTLEGLPELLPGRLFSTRMPRNLAPGTDSKSAKDFLTFPRNRLTLCTQ